MLPAFASGKQVFSFFIFCKMRGAAKSCTLLRMKYLALTLLWAAGLSSGQQLSKEARIERLLTLTNAAANVDRMFDQLKAMAASQMPPGSTPEQQAQARQMQARVMDAIKARMNWEKMRPQYVKLYDETFSDQEIDGMLAFYESPAGRAVLQKMPLLMQKSMSLGMAQVADVMPEIQRIVKEPQH
ncbi:MAG TPA: hypothetical protein DEQ47_02540 [Solibacterales bacterium]|nr:hypothetical protein [Bryobacterales bacterium]